jgi:HEAT repeat protein
MNAAVPQDIERALAALGAPLWRDRKQAAAALVEAIDGELGEREVATTIERLLDVMCAREPDARAGAREVLVRLGSKSAAAVAERAVRHDHHRAHGDGRLPLLELLGEIGDETHIEILADVLSEPGIDPNLRAAAAAALGRVGGERAVTELVALLDATSDMLRVYALDGLYMANAVVPVTRVRKLLESVHCRKPAVALLGLSRDPMAAPILVAALADRLASVRTEAALALARLDDELAADGRAGIVAIELAETSEEIRKRLREMLEHRDGEVRSAAMRLCGLAGDVDSIATILDVMDDPVAQERALALVRAFGPAANNVLMRAAERAVPAQREHLFRLVGAIPEGRVDPQLVEVLTGGLIDGSEDAAVAAAESLAKVGDRTSMAALYRAMAESGRLGEAAADAIAAVLARGSIASRDDLTLIVGTIWPHEGPLARNLCRVVGALGSSRYASHIVALLGSADPSVRVAAALALGRLPGEHEGGDALSFALADEEPLVRAAACRSLGQLASSQAAPALLAATHDRAPHVRSAAVHALVQLDNPIALARLRAIVAEDTAPAVVVQAIAGLGQSGLDQDLTMLMSLSLSADHEVVKAAASALVAFPSHRATAALLGLCVHDRWDVRWAAATALGRRADATAAAPLRRVLEVERDPLVREVVVDALARIDGRGARERRA